MSRSAVINASATFESSVAPSTEAVNVPFSSVIFISLNALSRIDTYVFTSSSLLLKLTNPSTSGTLMHFNSTPNSLSKSSSEYDDPKSIGASFSNNVCTSTYIASFVTVMKSSTSTVTNE